MPSSPEGAVCSREPRKGERMRFQDKVALITAAASGIGRATADIMAREGAIVIAVDNHEERLDRTVAALREAGGRAHRRLCNALDAAEVDATVASVAAGVRRDRHPGQRGRRQHDHPEIRCAGRGAELRRLAEADRLQPVRHVPVHPCGGAGDEAAGGAARSSTWPRSPAAASASRAAAPMPRRRAASSPSPASSPSSSGPTASRSTRSRRAAP